MTLNLALGKTFISMRLAWLQLWSSRHYTKWIPAFSENTYYTLHHKGDMMYHIYHDDIP